MKFLMPMGLKILFITLLSLWFEFAQSQDLTFSQFYNAPLQFNPATTGITTGPRFIINYRNQWPQLQNAYISYDVSYDQHFSKSKVSLGILILNDQQLQGIYNSQQASGIFCYQMPFTQKLKLNTALQLNYVQRNLDWSQIYFGDQIDPNTGQVLPTTASQIGSDHKSFLDFNGGIMVYSKKFYSGITIKHITQPDQSFYSVSKSTLPINTTIGLGMVFQSKANPDNYFSPNIVFSKQEKFRQLNVGGFVGIGPVLGGLSLRHTFKNTDALILMVGFKKSVFKMAYSYDSTLYALKGNSGGSHEISLCLNLAESEKFIHKQSRKQISECPQIF